MKNKLIYCLIGMLVFIMPSCKKGLDKYYNANALNPDFVWKDTLMIRAFLNDIYGGLMPDWTFNGTSSDEGFSTPKSLGNYQRGVISVDQTTSSLSYTYIEKINFFLDNLAKVPATVLPSASNTQLAGQAKFWRAWAYWNMVQNVGGVPIILTPQSRNDSLFVPRNKTSECITQIVKDLDDAIAALPATYSGTEYGRITKIAAMTFKGKVLMWYASPLFNPSSDAARWQAAYDANKAAVDAANAAGYGLYSNYRNIWYIERNKEVLMVRQHIYPGAGIAFNGIRPEPMTKDASNNNQPLLSLLLAYPKKDGSPMQFDKNQLADPAYNTQFMTDFYTNRDDRFYATIFYGGVPYPTPDELSPVYIKGNSFWNVWRKDANGNFANAATIIHAGLPGNPGYTGFFDRKGLDTTLIAANYAQGQTDWPELRYAELYMNYGECANEVGKSSEALQVLYDIRKRANVTAGSGNYGITASSQSEIRTAYINERQVEFAFENKRLPDLRRWKRYDILNSQVYRHGLYITMNTGVTVLPSETIMNAATRAKFTAFYIDNLDGDNAIKFNLDLTHWFYAIPPSQVTQSKNVIIQNNEWGGSFDPLK